MDAISFRMMVNSEKHALSKLHQDFAQKCDAGFLQCEKFQDFMVALSFETNKINDYITEIIGVKVEDAEKLFSYLLRNGTRHEVNAQILKHVMNPYHIKRWWKEEQKVYERIAVYVGITEPQVRHVIWTFVAHYLPFFRVHLIMFKRILRLECDSYGIIERDPNFALAVQMMDEASQAVKDFELQIETNPGLAIEEYKKLRENCDNREKNVHAYIAGSLLKVLRHLDDDMGSLFESIELKKA
ncbi:hypothetical protein ACLMJK_001373 [Lecanora helva]